MKANHFIQRLENEQNRLAREALEKPSDRTDFGYGFASGMHAGLEHAKNLLLKALEDEEHKGQFL